MEKADVHKVMCSRGENKSRNGTVGEYLFYFNFVNLTRLLGALAFYFNLNSWRLDAMILPNHENRSGYGEHFLGCYAWSKGDVTPDLFSFRK